MEPPVDAADWLPAQPAWQPRPKFQDRIWLHGLLFVLTIVTTTYVGAGFYAGFVMGVTNQLPRMPWSALAGGLWYSGTALTILTCHELGHYLACRYYNIDASRPFFIPAPISLGTMGAFIRIRERIRLKREFFDIGIAGPIAGFLVTVPALFIGLSMSTIVKMPDPAQGMVVIYGDSLLLKLASRMVFGSIAAGYDINAHPMVFGAWFGMLATALNLLPFCKLDGCHVSYCVLGRKSSYVSIATEIATAALSLLAYSWIVWTVLLLLMMRLLGRDHPPVEDEGAPLDRARLVLAAFALVILVLCFMPVPISFAQ